MVTLTTTAMEKAKELMKEDDSLAGKSLRVFVEQGGCSGYQYGFSFDVKKPGDAELPLEGLHVVVDAQSAEVLKGSVIDFKEDFSGSGFAVSNPNATKTCGCGHSFEA